MKSQSKVEDGLVLSMPSGMWYGDQSFDLPCSPDWDLTVLGPETPPEMTIGEIAGALEHPTGQPPLRTLARGAKRPVIIVDDVNRPTPVYAILPCILRQLAESGITAQSVTVVLATGAHDPPRINSVRNKVGEAAAQCRVVVHDASKDLVRLGRTSFGSPVLLNKEVASSDFVIGIGGVYPNSTAGYGGGSKLALGVLGFQSILSLHYLHGGAGRGLRREQDTFRQDLDEIARMIRLRSLICAHVNAECKIVRLRCGDYLAYYEEERAFAERAFGVPSPGDADVVIANAYPNDLSLTFALMKGAAPLHACNPNSSRILLSRCSEGLGGHRLFPVVNVGRFHALKMYMRFAGLRPMPFAKKSFLAARKRLRGVPGKALRRSGASWTNPVHLYVGADGVETHAVGVSGVRITRSWAEILSAVQREQSNAGRKLKVVVYPCAPLLSFTRP